MLIIICDSTFIIPAPSSTENSNEEPGLILMGAGPGGGGSGDGAVKTVNFTSNAEQSSQGPVSRGIIGSAKKRVKRKLDSQLMLFMSLFLFCFR